MPIQTRCLAAITDWTCLVRLLPLPMSIKQHMQPIIWLQILTDEKYLNIASRENLTNGIGREGREFPKGIKMRSRWHVLDQHTQELGRSMRLVLTPFGTHPDCSSWIGFPVALPSRWTLGTIIWPLCLHVGRVCYCLGPEGASTSRYTTPIIHFW